ncbi:MAG: hypothetical protein SO071_09730, partial [Prevotella sp.]|nr:hypothetical protein [Prevotella sp.]
MLLQVTCNQMVMRGDLYWLPELEKLDNFSFSFGLWIVGMGGKDGGVEGCCQLRTVDLWACGWSF